LAASRDAADILDTAAVEPPTPLDLDAFDVLTFDCYGTLIDWEAGILAGLRPVIHRADASRSDDDWLAAYARAEAAIESGPYRRYREVLEEALRRVAAEAGVEPTDAEVSEFGGSVVDWPPFPDSAAALARLATRYRLAVITNCDDDLFAASNRHLGVTFDPIVTAEQVGSYKPDERNFAAMFEPLAELGIGRSRILHVAQSLFHDHAPAKRLGLATVWVNRRHDRPGSGATPPAVATPDLTVPDLATLAALAVP
jgi:2-haloacid dehalogenase